MTRNLLLTMTLLFAVGVVSVSGETFNHKAHLEEYLAGESCGYCHKPDSVTVIPSTEVCQGCHDTAMLDSLSLGNNLTHGPLWTHHCGVYAKAGAINCAGCHEDSWCLDCHKSGFGDEMGRLGNNMINVHRSDFNVTHPLSARTDQTRCSQCHEPDYCNECHESWRFTSGDIGSPSHRKTFSLGFDDADFNQIHQPIRNLDVQDASLMCDSCHLPSSVAPDFHDWSIGHAREARRSLASCQACHP